MDLSTIKLIRDKDVYAVYDGDTEITNGDGPHHRAMYQAVYRQMADRGYAPVSDGRTTTWERASPTAPPTKTAEQGVYV